MAKVLIYQDLKKAGDMQKAWEKECGDVQNIINLYSAMQLPKLQNADDLYQLCNNTQHFIYKKQSGGKEMHLTSGEINDTVILPIHKHEAMKIIQKPAGYNELVAAIATLSQTSIQGQTAFNELRWPLNEIKRFFSIDANGALIISDHYKNTLSDAGCYYVYTENGKALFDFAKEVIAAAEKYNIGAMLPNQALLQIVEQIITNSHTNPFENKMKSLPPNGKWQANMQLCDLDRHFKERGDTLIA
jgi:hypothetical protein